MLSSNNSKSSTKNNSNSNIMDTKYFSTFTLQDLGKEPTSEWSKDKKKTRFINKHKWKRQTLNQLKETYMKQNRGIVCGKHSDIIVVDLDFYEKYKEGVVLPFDRKKSKFLQDFGEDYIKKFNTLTFKTANGGEHLVFKYTPLIKTTANEEHNIDIRSDNSYIVAPSSVIDKSRYDNRIKKAKDKKGEYTILNAVDIKPLPVELETWLSMNLYRKKREPKQKLKKNCKGEITCKEAYEQDEVDLTQYSYTFDESLMIDILDGLPKSYFRDRVDWYIFTTAMKLLSFTTPEFKDMWDYYSYNNGTDEKTGKIYYNEEENESIWNSCNPQNYMCLEHLLDKSSYVSDAKTMLGYHKLRIDNIHTTLHDKEVELRYLDKDSNGKFFNDIHHRYILCRSDTGTGKTTAFKNYITKSYEKQDGNYKRFISVVSRISLGKEQVKVFREAGIECFWHEDIETWYDHEGYNIVITIDSLMKMGNWCDFESYDIYLDEYNSLIEYFVDCPNLCNKRTIIWKYFNQLLTQGDKIIMTDADISDNSIRFLLTLDDINRNDIIYINNKYKHNEGIEATELFSYNDFCDYVGCQERAMVCLDSKNVGEKFVIDMQEKYDINFTYYSSDYTGDIDLDAHDFVAFSPKVVYGLDSVMERPVFCYYKCHTISPPAMVQQINRCRKITHLYYLFESKTWKAYKYDNVEEVLFEIQEGKKLVVDYFSATYDKQESDRYDKILASFRFTLDCYNTNKFAHFLRIIKMRGFVIDNELQYNEEKITKSKGLSNQLKEELQGYKQEEILSAWDKVNKEVKEIQLDLDMQVNQHINNILHYGDMDDPKEIENYIKDNVWVLEDKEVCDLSYYEKTLIKCDFYCKEFHKDYKCPYHSPEEIRLKYFKEVKQSLQEVCKDMDKELIRKYLPETWCDIIDLINLPFDKIGDPKYNVFMRDPQELERLYRTNSFFNKDIEGLSELLEKKMDFDSQKYQSSQSRFIYTKKLMNAVGLSWENNENKEMKMSKLMNDKEAEKLQAEYELTFRTRSKKLDFKQSAQVKSTIIRIMKLMFGKKIIDSQATSKMVEKMKLVNGKLEPTGEKKTQKITRHFINEEWVGLCKEIYGFYHKEVEGVGKNKYQIDTCEIE